MTTAFAVVRRTRTHLPLELQRPSHATTAAMHTKQTKQAVSRVPAARPVSAAAWRACANAHARRHCCGRTPTAWCVRLLSAARGSRQCFHKHHNASPHITLRRPARISHRRRQQWLLPRTVMSQHSVARLTPRLLALSARIISARIRGTAHSSATPQPPAARRGGKQTAAAPRKQQQLQKKTARARTTPRAHLLLPRARAHAPTEPAMPPPKAGSSATPGAAGPPCRPPPPMDHT